MHRLVGRRARPGGEGERKEKVVGREEKGERRRKKEYCTVGCPYEEPRLESHRDVLGMDPQEASQHGPGGFEEEAPSSGQGGLHCEGEEPYAFTEGTDRCQKLCGKVS